MEKNRESTYLKLIKNGNSVLFNTSESMINITNKTNIIYSTTVLAVAPILFTYIMWVVEEAKKKQIKRLYFLARDGYIMKEIAQIICKQYEVDIECRYLYCSRIAWRIPQYYLEKEKCLDKICINSVEVNLNKIFERANLLKPEKEEIYQLMQINEDERNRHLQWYEVLQYKEKLSKCDTFMQYVYKHSEEAYEVTIGYLKQEGLLDNIKYAIVDTGWTGSMQTSLSCLLNNREIEGYYFGIYNLPREANPNNFNSFYFGKKSDIRNKVHFNNNLFECLCSSPDGMTIGYEKSEDKYIPRFSSQRNINMGSWDIDLHIDTIIRYVELAVKQENFNSFDYKKSKKLVFMLCKEFMVHPSLQEAECYGDFKFSDDVTENNIKKLAADMTFEEIKQNYMLWRIANRLKFKKFDVPYKQSCWIDASIKKCDDINREKNIRHILLFRWVQYIYMRISSKY